MITRNYLKNLEQKKLINVFVVTAKIFKNWVSFNGFKCDVCIDCNLIFMNPQLEKKGLKEFYENYIGETRLNND